MDTAVLPERNSPGSRAVGRYELKEKLGEGGMGVVWRALDSRIGGDVALKIMKDCSDSAAMELFSKEWRALADLSHPNIVDVRDVDVLVENGEQKPFFVMPLLRGSTLSDLIKNSSERLTVSRVVEIVSQVCRGLQAAHQRGLIHRDLKPSNIFVMDDDTAKVIDFGVVYLAGSNSMPAQKGTYQYMSPEQIQMKEVAPPSDLFSMGVVLYEALTGRKPFACATVEDTMQAVLKRTPPPVSELNPGIPRGVSQVVHKCLAKQAIHRFTSAKELADTLQRAYRGEEVFESAKLKLRLDRVRSALKTDEGFASELLSELESEGHLDSEITMLRMQIDLTVKQRKVRQLIESARTRIEQGEIALGLDKLREVLDIDPENAEAQVLKLSTENKRSEAQAERWVQLGRTHLDNCDFPAAKHAVQEALASRGGDTQALDLLHRIEVVEAEARRVRDQKEHLYTAALNAYQHGEIDSALSRMVRLFSVVRSRPEGAVPERDAVYESFYQQVRSEHDSNRLLLEQAQREFSEEHFQEALALCAQHLARYPLDGAFQALKIQVEDAERQKVSSYIAMVTKNADSEPDLDRRANILREASERYPDEAQFAQQFKVVRERRDLVNSIVAKARQFAERGQYSEALSQWDMLRNIHPRYPGLSFELEQCRKKHNQQSENEEKARQVEEIVRLMDTRDFTKALDRTRMALKEYPGDTELAGLEKLTAEAQERAKGAERFLALGQAEAVAANWHESADYLRQARKLDPRNVAVKEALICTLTEHARAILDKDLAQAQQLQREAATIDENHRSVRILTTEISEAKRQAYVGECLTEARAMVAEGDAEGAYERIRKGREEYPGDMRLEQFQAGLVRENSRLQLKQERERQLDELNAACKRLEHSPDPERARDVLLRTQGLTSLAQDDPETMRRVAEAQQAVRRVTGADDLSVLQQPETDFQGRDSLAHGSVLEEMQLTRLESPRKKVTPPDVPKKQQPAAKPVVSPINVQRHSVLIAAVCAMLLIGGALLFFQNLRHRATTQAKAPHIAGAAQPVKVHVSTTPEDSVIRADGVAVTGGDVAVPAGRPVSVEVSRAGYRTSTVKLDGKQLQQAIALEPLPTRVSLALGDASGYVSLDGNKIADLSNGVADLVEIPGDGKVHALAVVSGGKRVAGFTLKTGPGEKPQLEPLGNADVIAVASLGQAATVYGGEQMRNAQINGTAVRLSNKGTDLPLLKDGANELTYVVGNDTASMSLVPADVPSVQLHALGAGATMQITSNVDSASLSVNGKPIKRGHGAWQITQPGAYQFALSANGFETQTWTALLKPRQSINDARKLVARAVVPVAAALVIAGGTPGTQVRVDGRPAGELNGSGAGQFAGLAEGTHRITLHKEGFCDTEKDLVANPPGDVRFTEARLEPCGGLTLRAAEGTTARVRRSGDAGARWSDLTAGRTAQLPAGKYEAHVVAAGKSVGVADVTVEAGKEVEFTPPAAAPVKASVAGCQLQSPGDAAPVGEWLNPVSKGTILLTRGCVNGAALTFLRPEGGLLKSKKIEWTVKAAGGSGQIEYEISGDRFKRKSTVHGGDHAETAIDKLKLNDKTYVVKLQIDGFHIRVMGPGGDVVDDYDAHDTSLFNLRGGTLGLKTGGEFKLSGGA